MKLRELETYLQDIDHFRKPKQELEQYITGAKLASLILHEVSEHHEDFESSLVVDLGCGTGMLSIGAALLHAPHVIGIDIDADALDQALDNAQLFDDLPIDLIAKDVTQLTASDKFENLADIVLMNPPFGSWHKGADMAFLRASFLVSRNTVYSLHKRSTRSHIQAIASRQLHATSAEVIAELAYDLPATYKHHRKASKDIEVDLWRFEVPRIQGTAL